MKRNIALHAEDRSATVVHKTRKKVPLSFEAKYHGTCADCLDPIEPGQIIRYNPDDEVVHARHNRPEEVLAPPCTSCWMVHKGECL